MSAISAITRDHGDRRASRAAALCLCTLSQIPTPLGVLLKTNVKVQFDRTVDATFLSFLPIESDVIFLVFLPLQPSACRPVGSGS